MKANNRTFRLNNKLSLLLLSSIVLLSSCKKSFLEVPTQGQTPAEQFWITQEHATNAVHAMYANLRKWEQVAFASIGVESLGSDDAEKGSFPGDASFLNSFDNFTVTSTEGQVYDFWKGQYQQINLCNQVLDNIPGISMDASLKARYLLESK